MKITTFVLIIIILLFINIVQAEEKYFIMTSTAYSNHPKCIAKKWRDGTTATNTPIREGVVAINVDKVHGKWQVRSPLRLGQAIYIEGIGEFSIEDTGSFSESNLHFDYWNLDIYFDDYEEAKAWGVRKVKVYIILKEVVKNGYRKIC